MSMRTPTLMGAKGRPWGGDLLRDAAGASEVTGGLHASGSSYHRSPGCWKSSTLPTLPRPASGFTLGYPEGGNGMPVEYILDNRRLPPGVLNG